MLTFYGSFPVLLMDFPFPSRNSSLLSRPYLKVVAVPQERSGKYEITTKVISGNFTCDELKLCYGKYATSVQQQPWQSKFFFPRNQVLHCYVIKVNNDSLNDPKKKNQRLAPLKGICTGKFDNVTNHSSKHYLKTFSLRWASQQHTETTAVRGCCDGGCTKLCFSIFRPRSIQKKLHIKKAV